VESRVRGPVFTMLDMLVKQAENRMKSIEHKIMILSGKGGVGKSFVSSTLSLALADMGFKVAVLDADLHGSSIPTLLGIEGAKHYYTDVGIQPVEGPLGLKVVSVNFMLPSPDTPLAWRGPLKSRAIVELLAKVDWGDADFLVIDMPPGTGDEAITIVQVLKSIDGALVVTAPGVLSELVVSKSINFVVENGIRLLGIVENMSYFKCPETGKIYYLLGRSSGEELARKYNTQLLAKIPLDPYISEALSSGKPYYLAYPNGEAAKAVRELGKRILELIGESASPRV